MSEINKDKNNNQSISTEVFKVSSQADSGDLKELEISYKARIFELLGQVPDEAKINLDRNDIFSDDTDLETFHHSIGLYFSPKRNQPESAKQIHEAILFERILFQFG